jgi:hypothetical protein
MTGTIGYVHVPVDRIYRDVTRRHRRDEGHHHSLSCRIDHDDFGRTGTSYIDVSATPGLNGQRVKAGNVS